MARAYRSELRDQAAQETRQRIVSAATHQLVNGGYAGMTVAGLARAAGVSPQTLYNAVGGKAEVVKAAYDLLVAGDQELVPMSARPEFTAVTGAGDAAAYGAAYAAWTRGIYERVGDFLAVLLGHGPAGDPVLEEFVRAIDLERRRGNEQSIPAKIRQRLGLRLSRAVDVVWLLTSPEVHDRLVRKAGWSRDAYERWLAGELARAVTDRPATDGRAVG
jgi:AcrR family transcriptional regulator